uniref:Transcriptional regulator, LuxR family n=2 Tax=Gloeothece TaxID=28070 RepID=E0UM89_GLOV7|nr:transcriptional regulator, LuxR family [Gloeothece verrucosa PCC 7822]
MYSLSLFDETEMEIVKAFCKGSVENSKLRKELNLSESTICYRLKAIRLKMHANDLEELAYKFCSLRFIEEFPSDNLAQYYSTSFTETEQKILRLICQGIYKPRLIANCINCKISTVKTHLGNIRNKLHCSKTAEVIIKVFQSGIARKLSDNASPS